MSIELTRDYKMSDADLLQRADLLGISIARDAADFAARAVDAARIALMTDARDAFDETSTDEELLGELMDKTLIKEELRREVEVAVRSIRNMADVQYKGKGKYNSFGFDDLTHLTDNNLYRATKRIARVATKLLPSLALQGLTAPTITALTALNTTFDDAIDAVGDAVETRDLETQTRIEQGNTLWAHMSELALIGKGIYQDTDEARWNDYILNDSPSQSTYPKNYTGTVNPSDVVIIATVPYKESRVLTFTNTGAAALKFSLRVDPAVAMGTEVLVNPGSVEVVVTGSLTPNTAANKLAVANNDEYSGSYMVDVSE